MRHNIVVFSYWIFTGVTFGCIDGNATIKDKTLPDNKLTIAKKGMEYGFMFATAPFSFLYFLLNQKFEI